MSGVEALSHLQAALVAAWSGDAALEMLIGAGAVFDAPPRGKQAPYVTILRHDAAPRDGDETPGLDHRMVIHCWSAQPSRKAALAIATRIEAVALTGTLEVDGHAVTLRRHIRTETAVDLATGRARAAITLRFLTEPEDGE